MKKLISIILLCLLLAACAPSTSAPASSAEPASKPTSSAPASSNTSTAPPSSTPVQTAPPTLEKSMEILYSATWQCGNIAVKDSDTVFFSAINILAKITPDGQVVALQEFPDRLNSIAVHGDYVYYTHGGKLCRIKKDGSEPYTYPGDTIFATIYVDGDLLSVTVGEEKGYGYRHADITGDPDILNWEDGYGMDIDAMTEPARAALAELDALLDKKQIRYRCPYATEKYFFFKKDSGLAEGESSFKRLDRETGVIDDVPYYSTLNERRRVVDGWLYYHGKETTCRFRIDDPAQNESLLGKNVAVDEEYQKRLGGPGN